ACQYVIKHESGNRKLRQCTAHCFVNDSVNTASDKHAATLDVYGPNCIREQHDGENEPRCGFAYGLLGDTWHVIGRGAEIVQNDRCGTPERDKRKHNGAGDDNFCCPIGCTVQSSAAQSNSPFRTNISLIPGKKHVAPV